MRRDTLTYDGNFFGQHTIVASVIFHVVVLLSFTLWQKLDIKRDYNIPKTITVSLYAMPLGSVSENKSSETLTEEKNIVEKQEVKKAEVKPVEKVVVQKKVVEPIKQLEIKKVEYTMPTEKAYVPPVTQTIQQAYNQSTEFYNSIEPASNNVAAALNSNSFTGQTAQQNDVNAGGPKVVENPKIRNQFPPEYPRMAVNRGMEGIVIVEALVNENGYPVTTKVYRSSGFDILDSAAMNGVKKWEFDINNLKGSNSIVRVPVRFKLNG